MLLQKITIPTLLLLFLFTASTSVSALPNPAPRVWSITPRLGTDTAGIDTFDVLFSEPVTGVDVHDFALAGASNGLTIHSIEAGPTPNRYVVTVATTEPHGSYSVALFDDDSIVDAELTPLGGVGVQNGNLLGVAIAPTHPTLARSQPDVVAGQMGAPRSRVSPIGVSVSLAVTSQGIPVMSYIEQTPQLLKLAVCVDTACNQSHRIAPTPSGTLAVATALALTATDIPVVSYFDATTGDLMLLRCDTLSCTVPTTVTVEALATAGTLVSLALTPAGNAILVYSDSTNQRLKLAVCATATCATPTITTLDATNAGSLSSMVLTTGGVPVITAVNTLTNALTLIICDTLACTSPTVQTIADAQPVSTRVSLALTSTNIPILVFYDSRGHNLVMAQCSNASCASITQSTLDANFMSGMYASLAMTPTDTPVIAYYDYGGQKLKLVSCKTLGCTETIVDLIDPVTDIGDVLALVIPANGIPIVSYMDPLYGNLRLFRSPALVDNGEPLAFKKATPGRNMTVTATEVVLSWAAAPESTSYEYCYAAAGSACTTWHDVGTNRIATISGLTNGAYLWSVRAKNAAGMTVADDGSEWSFTVQLPPGEFAKTSPANNAVKQRTTVTLSWGASTYATSYEYCISDKSTTCTTWKSAGSARSASVTGLAKNKSYFWQVRARNSVSATNASGTTWKFTTAP